MAKIAFFLFVMIVMFFPILISNKSYKKIQLNIEKKPLIEIFYAKFKKYKDVLEINGTFEKAQLFDKKYEVFDLFANDLIKNEKIFAKKAFKEDNLIKGEDVKYKNKDYTLFSKKIFYFEKNKFIKGWNFNFFSENMKGKGDYFEIDKEKNLFAKNIRCYLKVKK